MIRAASEHGMAATSLTKKQLKHKLQWLDFLRCHLRYRPADDPYGRESTGCLKTSSSSISPAIGLLLLPCTKYVRHIWSYDSYSIYSSCWGGEYAHLIAAIVVPQLLCGGARQQHAFERRQQLLGPVVRVCRGPREQQVDYPFAVCLIFWSKEQSNRKLCQA